MKNPPKYAEHLIPLVRSLPRKPGVYQFYDNSGKLLYVGKAKSLRTRVASYFTKDLTHSGKLSLLIRKTADIQCIVVETEQDALLLENNLIKKHQPRYNVMLKDDKTFPWICIRKEPFPRIYPTRNLVRDGSEYFGPYASVRAMKNLLDLIRQLYPLRNCQHSLTPQNIRKKKFSVCLEYHLGNCKGPCEGLQPAEDYGRNVAEIREIIRGNIASVTQEFRKRMHYHAGLMEFERAQEIKDKLDMLERYQSKSTIVNPRIRNVAVFSIISGKSTGYINFMKVVNGAIVQSHTLEMKKKLDEPDGELLTLAITEMMQKYGDLAPEIITPIRPETAFAGVKFSIPRIGDKKKLLELSIRNARYYRMEKEKQQELSDPERHTTQLLERAKKDLRLEDLPRHIECFDNSNIQGDWPVAAMVCFINGRPARKEYRHFNIRTVEGPDDYRSMEEVIHRRYKRLLDEGKGLPQLIVVDGGKGQLNAALRSLERLGLKDRVAVIGLAKRLEEIFVPGDPLPLYLDKNSRTLRLIQQLRDEAHRFGLAHHRNRRVRKSIRTELEDVRGIGPALSKTLLDHFRSVSRIRQATLQEIQSLIGSSKGIAVYRHFHNET
ncbi:MAG: excinuclease ABC subunit C [Bacteroidales bacterium]|nr:excinuclease ABC subunit C [Bacteroidales bacterium]